jgi:hypothetical protein
VGGSGVHTVAYVSVQKAGDGSRAGSLTLACTFRRWNALSLELRRGAWTGICSD